MQQVSQDVRQMNESLNQMAAVIKVQAGLKNFQDAETQRQSVGTLNAGFTLLRVVYQKNRGTGMGLAQKLMERIEALREKRSEEESLSGEQLLQSALDNQNSVFKRDVDLTNKFNVVKLWNAGTPAEIDAPTGEEKGWITRACEWVFCCCCKTKKKED